jgi:hydroxylamine reductase
MSGTKPDMFCFQCEQTKDAKGCTTLGVCGKTPEVAALQDLLVHACKGIGMYTYEAMKKGAKHDHKVDTFVKEALFSTLTNVDFDPDRFRSFLSQAMQMKELSKQSFLSVGGSPLSGTAEWQFSPEKSSEELKKEAESYGVLSRQEKYGQDVAGVQELIMYGLKGMAAYADHAHVLGKEDPEVDKVIHEVLSELGKENKNLDQLLGLALKVGTTNITVMQNLDNSAVERYGHPTPTKVRTTAVTGKCILVSGHDLRDVENILEQTEGTGINVYTHGELLPAHGYPELKKYKHLVGNYGGAWQEQKLDFATFPGPIVMTTNCLIEPRKSYKNRLFTRGVVGWPGVKHIENYDFSEVVELAKALPGFTKDEVERTTMTGFGRNAVLSNAPKILDLINKGKLNHFFLIGGCDGSEGERSYFKDLALSTPKDSIVLTLGCGKYRFNKQFDKFGDIDGIPRMLDVGQCNDAFSAIQIAVALAGALKTDVNSLPLSFAVSWFEQKAAAVLLSLLSLNVQKIYLGPRLPAFVSPAVLNVLVEKFNIRPTGVASEDLHKMLQNL